MLYVKQKYKGVRENRLFLKLGCFVRLFMEYYWLMICFGFFLFLRNRSNFYCKSVKFLKQLIINPHKIHLSQTNNFCVIKRCIVVFQIIWGLIRSLKKSIKYDPIILQNQSLENFEWGVWYCCKKTPPSPLSLNWRQLDILKNL